jgi:hypothetical protein
MRVVRSEVEAAHSAKEAGEGKSEITMEIPMPVEHYARLKLLVSEKRVNGKAVTIQEYVQRLILNHVYKRSRL